MNVAPQRTIAEYFAFEDASSTKHELVNGQIVAMSGATLRHNAIAMNIAIRLGAALRGRGCRPLGSDMRVHVLATDLDTYPDLSIYCGEPKRSPEDKHALTNPTVLIEVLSPSTESYDRGAKWAHYQRIESLQEYVLVSTDRLRIERYRRIGAGDGGGWRYEMLDGAGGVMRLESCPASLVIDEVYEDVPAE